ncbi:hypothetical protein CLV81_3498 [Flagellimonas meridianipacifica]|uniref:Uncharacterized protein n=1 Tax=Flagellimonas meridianipacifica TaxID=1080225 RepID=A0A2T0MCC1_9FLAO|nr:hypothetical protein CLV81_3498 [Allomuricauda pacifica]
MFFLKEKNKGAFYENSLSGKLTNLTFVLFQVKNDLLNRQVKC